MSDNARFVADLTIPDDTELAAGTNFVKAWRIENNGDTAWEQGYHLVFFSGEAMAEILGHPIPPTQPGQTADLTLILTAPETPGTHISHWRLQNAQGNWFGEVMYARIQVPGETHPVDDGVSDGRYLTDITIPDGSLLTSGATFVKTWRVQNSGETTWHDQYHLVHIGGEPMTTQTSQPLATAAPGAEVDVSVTLTTPEENGRYLSRWRMQDPQGQRFGQVLFLDINVIREQTTQWEFNPALWRSTIWAITSIFESGQPEGNPAAYQNTDAGIISYGKHQATLQSGTLRHVIDAYLLRSDSPTSFAIQQEYAARIAARDASLRSDPRLKQLLITAASEQAMIDAQDDVFEQRFYQPAVTQARLHNLGSPLGLACLYDTNIQGGLFTLLPQTKSQLGSIVGDNGFEGPIDEQTFINTFLDLREARLLRLADEAQARGEQVQAQALRTSTFRVEEYRKLLRANNLTLEGDLNIRGRIVPGIVFTDD
ncbi:MAG: chitosanase [Ardenticatenaceae bacterium]|nr:chitosanase [Anaerolineales bacterium]MCB8922015.1 chitosanase [Ardenticatenaceae bacterium]MCB8989591.1 chitosanase [Ardenticatenaceae bacterium]MCB9003134.1 chitosanase [Ardenticatenaceae bacterium]